MQILTGVHQVEAEAAAGRLRSSGIGALVIRDNEALLGVFGSSSLGTFSVSIGDSDEAEARSALGIDRRLNVKADSLDDGPFSATAVFVMVLLLVLGLVGIFVWNVYNF